MKNEFGVSRRIGKMVVTGIVLHEHKIKLAPEEWKKLNLSDPSDEDWLEAKRRLVKKSS